MPKKRNEKYKLKTFSLSEDAINNLNEMAIFEGMKKSEFVEYLVKNWESGINPANKLIELTKEKEKLMEKLKLIDESIKDTTNQIKKFSDWSKQKMIKKDQAIIILERKILDRDFIEAERISKVWQRITGIPSIELLMEAKTNLEVKGI